MPKFWDEVPENLREWIPTQPLFFTASAPLNGRHINVSPKGLLSSTFTLLSPTQAAYLDATGSGAETIAHVYENGRVTIMFCSWGKGARIVRLFCRGTVIEYDSPLFPTWLKRMGIEKKDPTLLNSARAVIILDIWKVQSSCGFGVPLSPSEDSTADEDVEKKSQYDGDFTDRSTLANWAGKVVADGKMLTYRGEWNSRSLDGLPSLRAAIRGRDRWLWVEKTRARTRRIFRGEWTGILFGVVIGLLLSWLWTAFAEFLRQRVQGTSVFGSME